MRDTGSRAGKPGDGRVIEVDTVREPHVGTEPTQLLHIVEWTTSESLGTVHGFVLGLRQMGVQSHTALASQQRGLTQQIRAYRERRARRQTDTHHGARCWVMPACDGRVAGLQRGVDRLHQTIGRQATGRPAQIHRSPGGVEPQADLPCCLDLGFQQISCTRGEHIVVVCRGGASRKCQPAQRALGCHMQAVRIDPLPDRVQGSKPLEERVIGGKPAGDPLVQMVMRVDQSRCE
ncbi:Uncharacterised protein [Mycobacteroides abscessus subsp. abscessus]|nr:Uncharacterised protein [Mycobacteroides abscessus subsp. abscessus]